MKIESDPKNDLWAFREGRKSVATGVLFRDLAKAADHLCTHPADTRAALSALMRAGEFESGISDAKSVVQSSVQRLTDSLARAALGDGAAVTTIRNSLGEISRGELPDFLSISPPEGFAYYALHPFDFARLADQVAPECHSAFVIGIRSIGTTLSAMVRAALQQRGKEAERITVRPSGHPYDRVVDFSTEQLQDIREWTARRATFLVVDEGPGRSGSSFLSAAEALTRAGVPEGSITLLGSRQPDVNDLCAQDARIRWARFRFLWPDPSVYKRFSDHTYIGGGNWRGVLLPDLSRWPACWPQMERLKFLSPDRKCIFKFEGFGRFGEEVLSRADVLAQSGLGCAPEAAGDGMILYPVVQGHSLQASDISAALLRHLAQYCAFRAANFGSAEAPSSQLPAMVGFNLLHEFEIEVGSEVDDLCSTEIILADGRMQPYEWIRQQNGDIIKVDAYTHGDDHFFPGPTDIAWDLAGTIVEWNLDQQAADFLVSEFQRISGVNRTRVLPAFILSYLVFRTAYWKMALSTVIGSADEQRVAGAYQHYRGLVERHARDMNLFRTQRRHVAPAHPSIPLQPGTAA
jgi:hypothetical protein